MNDNENSSYITDSGYLQDLDHEVSAMDINDTMSMWDYSDN